MVTTIRCDSCGHGVKTTDEKCPYCGVKFDHEKKRFEYGQDNFNPRILFKPKREYFNTFKCDNCDAEHPIGTKICPNCGRIFAETLNDGYYSMNGTSSIDIELPELSKEQKKTVARTTGTVILAVFLVALRVFIFGSAFILLVLLAGAVSFFKLCSGAKRICNGLWSIAFKIPNLIASGINFIGDI